MFPYLLPEEPTSIGKESLWKVYKIILFFAKLFHKGPVFTLSESALRILHSVTYDLWKEFETHFIFRLNNYRESASIKLLLVPFEADKYEISVHAFIEFVECERSVILFLIVSVLFLLIQIFGIQRVQLYHADLIVPFKYLGKLEILEDCQLHEGDRHVITFFLIYIDGYILFDQWVVE